MFEMEVRYVTPWMTPDMVLSSSVIDFTSLLSSPSYQDQSHDYMITSTILVTKSQVKKYRMYLVLSTTSSLAHLQNTLHCIH